MLTIDGAMGEGGGQVLRSALTLAMCLRRPLRMLNVRARRDRPGLQPQHLAAVRAAAQVCDGDVEGAALGSPELSFFPGPVRAGDYRLAVGTAGSVMLVLQTILPALLTAAAPSRLTLEGGTHNPRAPSFEFIAAAYLPLINRMGPSVRIRLERVGFYPRGGGRVSVEIAPAATLAPLRVPRRGALQEVRARILLSRLPRHIADREAGIVCARLRLAPDQVTVQRADDSLSPGNVVTIFIQAEHVCEVVAAHGRRGLPAEDVATEAVGRARRYLDAGVPVGPHLADQLLLPLVLGGGGSFATVRPSAHTNTNIELIHEFLPARIDCEPMAPGRGWRLSVR